MFYRDIKDDAITVFGACDGPELRKRVTQAINVLANTGDGNWDGMVGEMTLCVDNVSGTITLPRDVLKPLQINTDGLPTFPRDRWFLYHLNGPGSRYQDFRGAWDDRGTYPTFREPKEATRLKFAISDPEDEGKEIRVDGVNEDGVEIQVKVTLSSTVDPETTETFKRILRVNKDLTVGQVTMSYMDPEEVVAGVYEGDEKNPAYRRIRVSASDSVQLIYRRQTREILNDDSYIPLGSEMAIMQALWSIKKRFEGNVMEAQQYQQDAQLLLEQDQYARMVSNSPVGPQVLDYSTWNNERLRYPGEGSYHRAQ